MAIATIELPGDLVREVERALPKALRGDAAAARRYARAWRGLVRTLLASYDSAAAAADVLDHVALTAPFHPDGPIQALLSAAAGIIQGMRSLLDLVALRRRFPRPSTTSASPSPSWTSCPAGAPSSRD